MERTSRGYLPHRERPGASQFVTWRLADALSSEEWVAWRKAKLEGETRSLHSLAESHLDEHSGSAILRNGYLAKIVLDESLNDPGILSAVVMPNHVHVVLRSEHCGQSIKRIKGRSAMAVNRAAGRAGRLWQPERFDRLIGSEDHLVRCIHYIHWNPVKAGLCGDPRHYPYSTAHPDIAPRIVLR